MPMSPSSQGTDRCDRRVQQPAVSEPGGKHARCGGRPGNCQSARKASGTEGSAVEGFVYGPHEDGDSDRAEGDGPGHDHGRCAADRAGLQRQRARSERDDRPRGSAPEYGLLHAAGESGVGAKKIGLLCV